MVTVLMFSLFLERAIPDEINPLSNTQVTQVLIEINGLQCKLYIELVYPVPVVVGVFLGDDLLPDPKTSLQMVLAKYPRYSLSLQESIMKT